MPRLTTTHEYMGTATRNPTIPRPKYPDEPGEWRPMGSQIAQTDSGVFMILWFWVDIENMLPSIAQSWTGWGN